MDARMSQVSKGLREVALELIVLSKSIGSEMTLQDRYFVGVKVLARLELLIQFYELLIERAKQPKQDDHPDPADRPF